MSEMPPTELREHVHRGHKYEEGPPGYGPIVVALDAECEDCRAREATIAEFDKTFTAMNAHILALDARLTESEYARDSLRLERDGLEHMRIRDNEELIRQRDAMKEDRDRWQQRTRTAEAAATRAQGALLEPTPEAIEVAREWMSWFVAKHSSFNSKREAPDVEATRLSRKILDAQRAAYDAARILDPADTGILSEIREVSGALDEAAREMAPDMTPVPHEYCGEAGCPSAPPEGGPNIFHDYVVMHKRDDGDKPHVHPRGQHFSLDDCPPRETGGEPSPAEPTQSASARRSICDDGGKRVFRSESEAATTPYASGKFPRRVYACDTCKGWHRSGRSAHQARPRETGEGEGRE